MTRNIETEVVHAGERLPSLKGRPNSTPIYANSTFGYESMADANLAQSGEIGGYIYSRYGNPTVEALQETMRLLEGGAVARAFGSGMAALHAALLAGGLRQGSTVLASSDLYGATFALLEKIFGPFGVRTEIADFAETDDLRVKAEAIRPVVLLGETISNPLLKVMDIKAVAEIAQSVGARFIVDSTFATPFLSQPLTLGADLVVHSATKYLGGHGDSMGGVVVAREASDEAALTSAMKLAGGVLSVWEAHHISRGIKTLALRLERQSANAEKLADGLRGNPAIRRILYPKFAGDDVAEKVLRRPFYGALVSIVLADDSRHAAWAFMDRLKLIVRATTLGDVFTTVSHSASSSHRELSEEHRRDLGIGEGLVRISVGIESVDDLLADVHQALA